MTISKPKYKIVKQSRENIWGKFNNKQKLRSKKWKFLAFKLDKKFSFFRFKRNRSLKKLYKNRLLNKQKLKSFYGNLTYSTLKSEFLKQKNKNSINITENFIISLETRLDIFLFRVLKHYSIFQVKQLINHKKIKVNNIYVSDCSFKLNKGDFIEINDNLIPVNETNKLPYTLIDNKKNLIVFLRAPFIKEIKYPFRLNKKFLFEFLNKK